MPPGPEYGGGPSEKKHELARLEVILGISAVREYCTPNLKLACFVCYLKIVNTFMINVVCIL